MNEYTHRLQEPNATAGVSSTTLLLWAITAALAGFLFGFDTAVISGAEQAVQRSFGSSDLSHGVAISAALWGTVIGALFGGIPSNRIGRRATLLVIGILYTVSALGSALAWDAISFMAFRFIGGLGVGASSVAAPAYIAEIAPKARRGQLVVLYQLMLVLGILVAFLSNYLLAGSTSEDWRWMLGIEAIPALLYSCAVLRIPESPRWLLVHHEDEPSARRILARIDPDNIERIIAEIQQEDRKLPTRGIFSKRFTKPVLLVLLLAAFNQLSGINAVIYYAPRIFELTGSGQQAALYATVGVGVTNLIFTIIGMVLIDRVGRRRLLFIGSIGYISSLSSISFGFYAERFELVPVFIFVFIASHAIGQGAVIWVYIAEVFSNVARAAGQALGTGMHWVLAALLALVMPVLLTSIPAWMIFATFATFMVLQLIYVLTFMVETKGRTLEEIAETLSKPPLERAGTL